MFTFAQLLLSVSMLWAAPACTRVEPPRADGSAPDAPALYDGDAIVVPSDDQGDAALAVTRRLDTAARTPEGRLPPLAPAEHMRRAAIYHASRAFEEARAHWRALIERYPDDSNVPAAHFGIGRTLFQERRYEEALPVFENLGAKYLGTAAGRDGFYYVAATLLRMDRPGEAAPRYAEYATRFPEGERVEAAYLNAADSFREAGQADEAAAWIARTRERFSGKEADTSALFARLRLDISRGDWQSALRAGEELSRARLTRNVNTTQQEVAYLRAYSLEQSGQKEQAVRAYQGIADTAGSYYGERGTARLRRLGVAARRSADEREARARASVLKVAGDYPAPHREALLRATKGSGVDPRFMLAIMRQESSFNPRARSQAGARGLMQLTVDAAARYAPRAGLQGVGEDDLYRPEVSIALAGEYMAELARMFPNLPEAWAASYNGGEDSVARWVRRAASDDPGIFTSEVGFTETKDYVARVMANYRAYRLLYTEDLKPRR